MGISDMGMINVFRNFFQYLRVKYFDQVDTYNREIDYAELSNCFAYPAKSVQYLAYLNQDAIDRIYKISKQLANITVGEQYKVMRVGMLKH